VGTAGSANLGTRYAMFEAIHGSAERMIREGRGQYANPASICRAAVMMLRHMEAFAKADILEKALDLAAENVNIIRDGSGDTADDFTRFVLGAIK
jgi:isocitrate dehydrogenase (NAD+)